MTPTPHGPTTPRGCPGVSGPLRDTHCGLGRQGGTEYGPTRYGSSSATCVSTHRPTTGSRTAGTDGNRPCCGRSRRCGYRRRSSTDSSRTRNRRRRTTTTRRRTGTRTRRVGSGRRSATGTSTPRSGWRRGSGTGGSTTSCASRSPRGGSYRASGGFGETSGARSTGGIRSRC